VYFCLSTSSGLIDENKNVMFSDTSNIPIWKMLKCTTTMFIQSTRMVINFHLM